MRSSQVTVVSAGVAAAVGLFGVALSEGLQWRAWWWLKLPATAYEVTIGTRNRRRANKREPWRMAGRSL